MAEKSRFFDAELTVEGERDRVYPVKDHADYFDTLVTTGVWADLANALEVTGHGSQMKTILNTGKAFIKGYYYENDEPLELTHELPDTSQNRIDLVVLRLDLNIENRYIKAFVLTGTPGEAAPTLTQTEEIYEIALAEVLIIAGRSFIETSEITDKRTYVSYRAKPAWYPEGQVPMDAWMYVAFKNELTEQEISDIENNPSLMEIIDNTTVGRQSKYDASTSPTTDNDETEGYATGSMWFVKTSSTQGIINENNLEAYICLDAAENSAKWVLFSSKKTSEEQTEAPGSKALIDGDSTEGFFGEVSYAELISGDALASVVGISAGTSQHSTEPWLKFVLDDKILFVAKKTFRHTISWDNINTADCVYGGKTVQIGGLTYKVRLMKGALTDPSIYDATDRGAIGSEWNRLMIPIHVEAPSSWAYPAYVASPTKDWGIDYTDADLLTHNTHGNGSYSWCQEVRNTNASLRVLRGDSGVSYSGAAPSSSAAANYGWRPVLELVS